MLVKYRQMFLILLALLTALTLPGVAFGDYITITRLTPVAEPEWEVYNRLGVAKLVNSDSDGAIADFSKALELNPNYILAYVNRGNAKVGKSDWDGAIVDFSKAIELDPKYAIAYSNRGVAKKEKGDLAGADEDLAQAAKLRGR